MFPSFALLLSQKTKPFRIHFACLLCIFSTLKCCCTRFIIWNLTYRNAGYTLFRSEYFKYPIPWFGFEQSRKNIFCSDHHLIKWWSCSHYHIHRFYVPYLSFLYLSCIYCIATLLWKCSSLWKFMNKVFNTTACCDTFLVVFPLHWTPRTFLFEKSHPIYIALQ